MIIIVIAFVVGFVAGGVTSYLVLRANKAAKATIDAKVSQIAGTPGK